MIVWCVVLVAASLMPLGCGRMDWVYLVGALLLGVFFLRSTLRFRADRTEKQARRVLRASILYLPAMMALFLVHALGCARRHRRRRRARFGPTSRSRCRTSH